MSEVIEQSPQSCDQAGMTLLEVTMSLVIMGAVLVALGQGLTLGIRMNTESKLRISNVNLCKQFTEKLKSQIQYSQAVFDGSNTNTSFNQVFQTDADGNLINPGTNAPVATFKVTTSVSNWTDSGGNTLSALDSSSVSHVLVKVLNVTVLAQTSAISSMSSSIASGSSRETKMSVEMVRPAT
jgi:prepilin-type N-terminal cleavage/methylation domain-containing protein